MRLVSLSAFVFLPGAVTGRGVSRVGYQTAEAMVVRKGFSVEQLRECLEEYADLSVVQVRRRYLRRALFVHLDLALVGVLRPHWRSCCRFALVPPLRHSGSSSASCSYLHLDLALVVGVFFPC